MTLNKAISLSLLILLCAGVLLSVLPIINRNIEDQNLIAYFQHDENFFMNLLWYYYSGDKTESFQYEADYGAELLYLAGFSRVFLSRFIDFTPGRLILLLRWLHLIFWFCSILALWRLVRFHFGSYWQSLIIIVLLAVRPAFPYLIQNSKPEPVVLFFMIVGLDYLLHIIETPTWRNLTVAVICASAATLVKFAGIFLLPAIVSAMFFSEKYNHKKIFPTLKLAWFLPAIIGLIFIILPLILIFFYVRQSTGFSWYEQFGFWNSISKNIPILFLMISGILLVIFSFSIFILRQKANFYVARNIKTVNTLFSYSTIIFFMFILFSALIGLRLVIDPRQLIKTFATRGSEALIIFTSFSVLDILKYFIFRIKDFDIIIFTLFFIYLFLEIKFYRESLKKNLLLFFKRIVLAIFILQAIFLIPLPINFMCHHMLPFFAAASILALQCIRMIGSEISRKSWREKILLGFVSALLFVDVVLNFKVSSEEFKYIYQWKNDVVFDIADWWRRNYPSDISIVADHPVFAYLPIDYKNVQRLKYQKNKIEQLQNLVTDFKPQLVYYNNIDKNGSVMPPINQILPGLKVELVKSFDVSGKYYKRYPLSKFVIYRIKY